MASWEKDSIRKLHNKLSKLKSERVTLEKHIKDTLDNEVENFLFVAAGDGCIIKGMHYPEDAFDDGDEIPLVWKTSEKDVYIAAWPQDKIRELLLSVEKDNSEEEWEDLWKETLQDLLKKSIEKLPNAKDII